MRLTPEQDRAVRSWKRGDICVVAGPGSGKTRVLVERLRWLIVDREVNPENVLAITFTEKAAHEMRLRLIAEGDPSPDTRRWLEAAHVSTIDAFCNRLLKENALAAGVDPGFEILDETEGRDLLQSAIESVLAEAFKEGGEPLRAFLGSYAATAARSARGDPLTLLDDLAALVWSIRSYGAEPFLREAEAPLTQLAVKLRELGFAKKRADLAEIAASLESASPDSPRKAAALIGRAQLATAKIYKRGKIKHLVAEVKDHLLPECKAAAVSAVNAEARQWLLNVTRRILASFESAKRAAGRMDFDDVLAKAADLLGSGRGPELHFEHVLIDEFQDTNPLQIRLVERLLDAHGAQRPVRFVVGDINQSIYGFRHADQNVFREYRERIESSGGEVVRLTKNFRSRPEVLSAVHRVLPGGPGSGVERHHLDSGNVFPDTKQPSVEVRIVTDGGKDAPEREGLLLARRLHALKRELQLADRGSGPAASRPMRWGDVAVLTRTHARAAQLATALREGGVPCQTSGGRSLFQAPETAELAAFLRVMRNPRDEISLAAVLKSPLCGIDDATLLLLKRDRRNLADALANGTSSRSSIGETAEGQLRRFLKILADCRTDREIVPVRFLLARALSACGYRSFLSQAEDGPRALGRLDRLLDWIGRREEQGTFGIDDVSRALDQAIESRAASRAVPDGSRDRQAVEILTMHGAKGLEFPVVVLASLQSSARGPNPGLQFSERHGIGARWRDPFDDGPTADAAYRTADLDVKRREREEADRLFYVAMTRAEEHLILGASFPGAAQMRNWCRPVFQRLSLKPKEPPNDEPATRTAGEVQFLWRKLSAKQPVERGTSAAAETAGPQFLLPKARSAQADYVAAVTAIAAFGQCPRRYYLTQHLQLDRSRPQSAARGVAADADRLPRDSTDASQFGEEVHAYLAGQASDATAEVRTLAARFEQHALGRRAAAAARIDKEMAFVFTVGDHLLRGTIDLLFEEGDERILLDYKTDRTPRRELEKAAARYAPQLQLYAAGLAKSTRPADRAIVFYLRHGQPVDVDISPAAIADARDLVERFFNAQARHEYPLQIGRHCLRCPHLGGHCPAQFP